MTDHQRSELRRKRGISASVILGTVLVPLSAFAASVLISNGSGVEAVATSTTAPPVSDTVFAAQTATPSDLEAACGEAGLILVEAESDGSATEVQQAALDALREICDQQGTPLPGKPAPDPITQTVVVSRTSSAPAPTVQPSPVTDEGGQSEFEDEGEAEHEEEVEVEHEDEDDGEDEDEHEEGED
jgi:hypothetical protein